MIRASAYLTRYPPIIPCMRQWWRRFIIEPSERQNANMAKQRKQPKVFTPVTEDERKAISALQSVVFPVASPPKRFARDACGAERMTDAQRLLLWRIVHRFRRQIADKQLVRLAAERMQQPITESQPAQEQPAEPHWHRRANAGEPCPELVERLARTPNLK